MKEGLLSEKGKPNEKTPADWFSKYKEFTHYGQQSGPTPVSGAGDTSSPLIQPAPSSSVQSKSSGSGESVPSKKAKEEVESKKEESSSSDSSSDDSSDDE